jgi:hypothetical protein
MRRSARDRPNGALGAPPVSWHRRGLIQLEEDWSILDRLSLAGRDKFNTIFSSVLVAVMSLYRFSIHKNCARREPLGGMDLTDEAEAFAFGKRVIGDLIDRDAEQYVGWTMDITNGDSRAMVVPFDTVHLRK